jgi:hypothetical protein
MFLERIESNSKQEEIKKMLLESSLKNEIAHECFAKNGYKKCSFVFYKEL